MQGVFGIQAFLKTFGGSPQKSAPVCLLLQPTVAHQTALSEVRFSSHRLPISSMLDTP
jgi:hypothetical protein